MLEEDFAQKNVPSHYVGRDRLPFMSQAHRLAFGDIIGWYSEQSLSSGTQGN